MLTGAEFAPRGAAVPHLGVTGWFAQQQWNVASQSHWFIVILSIVELLTTSLEAVVGICVAQGGISVTIFAVLNYAHLHTLKPLILRKTRQQQMHTLGQSGGGCKSSFSASKDVTSWRDQPPPSSKSSAVLENHPHPLVELMPALCSWIHELCLKKKCFLFYNAEFLSSICGWKHVQRVLFIKKKKCKTNFV